MSNATGSASALEEYSLSLASDLAFFGFLHDTELTEERIKVLRSFSLADSLSLTGSPEFGKLLNSFDALVQDIDATSRSELDELAADFAAIYLNYTYHCSPMESVWLDDENLALQGAMFDVREIYAKFGYATENWRLRSEDHLVNQLAFIQVVLENHEMTPGIMKELADFYDEHLFLWIGDFCQKVSERCRTDFYAISSLLTYHYLENFRNLLAQMLETPRPTQEDARLKLEKRKRDQLAPTPVQFVPGSAPSW